MVDHEFGGLWSTVKLQVLERYLNAYATAMRGKFTLHYADAFAGTGSHQRKVSDAQAQLVPIEYIKGSAQRALDTNGFDRYHFNDLNPAHCRALEGLAELHPDKDICVSNSDANDFVEHFCASLTNGDRAVLFIDPYATQLQWATLEVIARSQKIDVWLLFPFASLSRLIPNGGANPIWEDRVTAMLGTVEWKTRAYSRSLDPVTADMFGSFEEDTEERIDQHKLALYISERLDTIFEYTSAPLPLKNSKNSKMFLLFYMVSNNSPAAKNLGKRLSESILKKPLQLV